MNYFKKLNSILLKKYTNLKKRIFNKKNSDKEEDSNSTFDNLPTYESYDYSQSTESVLVEKIELEKRRRYQAYTSVDYLLSNLTYFDFFSLDSLEMVKKAKDITKIFKQPIVTSDFLLLSFFNINLASSLLSEKYKLELSTILKQYGITEKEIFRILDSQKLTPEKEKEPNFLSRIPFFSKFYKKLLSPNYSYEVNQIFELAAVNALKRFKTPVISSEILLITILESQKSKGGRIIKQILRNDLKWYTLRYALIKRLHSEEFTIRDEVIENQQYFAYLLKSGLSEFEFKNLLDKDCLSIGVSLYRELLIQGALEIDVTKLLKHEIKVSIKKNNKRIYSN